MFLTVCLNPTLQKTLRYSSIISGTVNRTANHRLDVSGKGINVTRVLTQLGKKALHLTQLGGEMRPLFLSLCEKDGLSVEWVESNSQIRFCYTVIVYNVINDNDSSVTELVEESEAVGAETERQLLEKFDELLSRHDAKSTKEYHTLIISGTKAAGYSDAVIPEITRRAKEKGLRIILDIRGKDLLECLKYEPDIVKPNLYEFASTFAPELIKDNDLMTEDASSKEKIKSAVLEITRKYRCRVILTNGSRKIFAADGDSFSEIDIQPIKAVNSIGCGDAFTAGLAAAIEYGFHAAIREGMRCGALNASLVKPGVIR